MQGGTQIYYIVTVNIQTLGKMQIVPECTDDLLHTILGTAYAIKSVQIW